MYIFLNSAATDSIPVCRLCGMQCVDASYIDILGDAGQLMAFAIQKYLEIEISDKETNSKNVCHNCSRRVEDWNEFYNKCHQVQSTVFKNNPLIIGSSNSIHLPEMLPPTAVVENHSVSSHLSKLVEELVQDGPITVDKLAPVTHDESINSIAELKHDSALHGNDSEPIEGEDDPNITEDEFEEELTSEDESEENSEDSHEARPKMKPRQKKFIFTIPFLEKKVERKFNPEERVKLQKHISKRQNTLICKSQ